MASTSDFRNGLTIEFNGQIYTIVQFQHVKPGKGAAFVRTKMKNVKTGKVLENTFNAGVKVDVVRIERRPYQYLYKDEMGFNFMHTETFEQISLAPEMIENSDLMKEGQLIEVNFHADTETPLTAELPPFVELVISQTIPGEKGNTASSTAMKPATLETGAEIMVPLFINEEDIIKVDTRDRSYSERVKK
ncbi:elongation factor P [Sunxiuqinia elliptica]|uniref:Elongation factor P n=1 Tax=Sunxiuqinia elliptica TaxID=655355 RepID=A0A1I2D0B4_9BACT|nr:elongation factor P [Sunxiuqinia elliptica]TDO04039.1 elongation factor P [Sunxiuqinia elliptica]TDO62321.1 elongation factor P [Sunxiuqinia elliptica]SFE73430.1 elongation factor P [Sunxiuqinia elliptica]